MNKKVLRKLTCAICLLLISITASLLFNSKGVFLNTNRSIPIYSVQMEKKNIAITFDVNWGHSNTKKILDILDRYNIKGTFFLIGNWIDDYPEEAKEIYKRGHEIGNHSNSHPDMTKISKENIIREISTADAKIMKITGESSKLFRFPSGSYNSDVVELINNNGYYCIQWDTDSIDWKAHGSDKEYDRVMKKTQPGSILLFHNDGKYTPETLPRIIEDLKAKGYKFVKVGDLIYKKNYYINHEGKQIKK